MVHRLPREHKRGEFIPVLLAAFVFLILAGAVVYGITTQW